MRNEYTVLIGNPEVKRPDRGLFIGVRIMLTWWGC
jgi:hypothetical protein